MYIPFIRDSKPMTKEELRKLSREVHKESAEMLRKYKKAHSVKPGNDIRFKSQTHLQPTN